MLLTLWSKDWLEASRITVAMMRTLVADGEAELAPRPHASYPPEKWKLAYRLTGRKYKVRGESCQPDQKLMAGVAAGRASALAILEGWA